MLLKRYYTKACFQSTPQKMLFTSHFINIILNFLHLRPRSNVFENISGMFRFNTEFKVNNWMTDFTWWRHQMETFSALLALCARNSPVNGESPTQRPVTRSFDAFFDLRLNKRLSKQSWGWWSDTPSCSLWHQCNVEWGHANGYFKADGMGAARAVSWYCAFSTNKDTHYLLYDNGTSQ